jgi:hypothetical protein
MTTEEKARVEILLKKGADITVDERNELRGILKDEPPVSTPFVTEEAPPQEAEPEA